MQPEQVTLEFEGRSATLFGYPEDYFFQNAHDHLHGAMTLNAELRKLRPRAVICDVGANIGTTALAASYLIPGARILSFEPSPRALSCLQRTIEANGLRGVEVIEAAVGRASGQVQFAETDFLAGSHISADAGWGADPVTASVRVVTLDEVLLTERRLRKLDLLKIDVEGFELDVIEGAMGVIETLRPRMVVEYSAFGIVVNADGSPLGLLRRLLEMAGELSVSFPYGDVPIEPTAKSMKDFIFANMQLGAQDIAFSIRPGWRRPAPTVANSQADEPPTIRAPARQTFADRLRDVFR